jgi:carboxypeptidase T
MNIAVSRAVFRRSSSASITVLLALLVGVAPVRSEKSGAQDSYSGVRITLSGTDGLHRLAGLGISLEGHRRADASTIDLILNEYDIAKVRQAGYPVRTLIPDWHAAYEARKRADVAASVFESRVRGLRLGSMGGFLTLTEVGAQLDSMHLLFPQLIGEKDSIGRSIEGRTIWGVRVSAASAGDGNLPCVLFTALHHAREPEGMMTVLYFLWYVLEHYGLSEEVTTLLNTREVYVVPVVNPDGYAHNEATNPEGGGLWRKNRRLNSYGSYGVDLNRNYGYKWGADDIGSSAYTNDLSYRGAAPFSEPETQAIRDLCVRKKPACAMNYHSFGNDLIYPWGYSDSPTPDSATFKMLAAGLTASNYYVYGTCGATVGYTTNGDSDDWMYGEANLKPRIYAITQEVGGEDDGFWPLPSRILPIADANLEANILFAQSAGPHFQIASSSPDPVFTGRIGKLELPLISAGVERQATAAGLSFEGRGVDVLSPVHPTIVLGETTRVSLVLRRWIDAGEGSTAVLKVSCDYAGGWSQDSLSFHVGQPVVLFSDSADRTNALWDGKSSGSLTTWGFTPRAAFEGGGSYADSPWGDYPKNYSSTYTLQRMLPLAGAAAEMRFMARWDIEPEYDFCLVEASGDSGTTWTSLSGRYTRPASGASGGKQIAGGRGYDRFSNSWVEERIDLKQVLGSNAMLRFRFESDGYQQADGIYLDNIRVLLYPQSRPDSVQSELPEQMQLDQNFPNPFNPTTTIRFAIAGVVALSGSEGPATKVRLAVYDLLGREVAVLLDEMKEPGRYQATFNGQKLSSGVYLCRMTAEGFSTTRKMLLQK